MRIVGWNIHGFGRKTQIKELARKEAVDVLFLQETIRQDFTDQELRSLVNGEVFHWQWRSAVGHSGGMLLGLRDDMFEVGGVDQGRFFLSATVMHRNARFKFELIGVYGPADHAMSALFLAELESKVQSSQFPVVIIGDFNLIQGPQDKNNNNINWPLVNAFNECIANLALKEISRSGARFTWSNRQSNPVRSVLDRVLISAKWEQQFPLSSLRALPSIGSDHAPLVLDSRENVVCRSQRFFFQTQWFELHGFGEMLHQWWVDHAAQITRSRGPIDWWHSQSAALRQFLRGWGANQGKRLRMLKSDILARIQVLDDKADGQGLDEEGWGLRYYLEDQLLEILSAEEEYWCQRGRLQWTL
jgi:exonuclease III